MSNESMYDRIKNGEFTPPPYNRWQMMKYCEEHGKDWKEELAARFEIERKYSDAFEQACLEDVGLIGHPNANSIFAYAWEEGHSSGLYEVYQYLCEMSNLFFVNGKMLNAHKEN